MRRNSFMVEELVESKQFRPLSTDRRIQRTTPRHRPKSYSNHSLPAPFFVVICFSFLSPRLTFLLLDSVLCPRNQAHRLILVAESVPSSVGLVAFGTVFDGMSINGKDNQQLNICSPQFIGPSGLVPLVDHLLRI
ncbi:hypothetical protein BDV26DRAFT_182084 [Aspergillus bertholletiae]|uniref:Uncharacterized protein n=1 Tax=Aspergillus bertholletiae TaxID=1226010 RepID=A0A5N7BAT7_9EURO|nr:hypothetical protein BDV26DRAFT_182084 [Aspergillus bertholletiae]